MSYFLADANGPLDEFASIGGLADFYAWARTHDGSLGQLAREGFTEDLTGLDDILGRVPVPVEVLEQVEVLDHWVRRADSILIISDGMSDEEARALASKETAVHAAADAHQEKLAITMRYAFAMGRRALGHPPNIDAAIHAIKAALKRTLPKALLKIVIDGGEAGLSLLHVKTLGLLPLKTLRTADDPIKIRFDAKNQAAIDWADRHAAELVTQISETTREDINNAIAEALESGDFDAAYDKIFDAVGNDNRAALIARHETMLAASEGQRQAWDQAVEDGLLTGDEKRTWITVGDEKVCPICEELDGAVTDLDGQYPGEGGDGPPAHVACRCTEGITNG